MQKQQILQCIDELGISISDMLRNDLLYEDNRDMTMNGRVTAFGYLFHLIELKNLISHEFSHDFGEESHSISYFAKQKGLSVNFNEIGAITQGLLPKLEAEMSNFAKIIDYKQEDIDTLCEILLE